MSDHTAASPARRILGTTVGVIVGCGFAVTALVLIADRISEADGTSVAWALGLTIISLGALPALAIGAVGGGFIGRRYFARPRVPAWTERPAGTWGNHYPLAWVAAVLAAPLSLIVILPASYMLLATLDMFIGILMPRWMNVAGLLIFAVNVIGMVSVSRSTLHAIDRAIHAQRSR